MAELLLELFSEEIPAGLQQRGADDLMRAVCEGLEEAGLSFGKAQAFGGTRRLTLVVEDIPPVSPDITKERKGPRVGAPDKAIEGFLRAAGLESLDQCATRSDKKGDYYVAVSKKAGRPAEQILAQLIPQIIHAFSWPKSMRWGSGALRWVRPLHSFLCVLGGAVVSFTVV